MPLDPTAYEPAELADRFAISELEDLWSAAEAAGHDQDVERYASALMHASQPDLISFREALDRHLAVLDRGHAWSTWRDEGVPALRLHVPLLAPARAAGTPGLTYWIREADDGYQLLTDHVDAPAPTDFARRTARLVPRSRFGLKRIEHLIAAQVTF